MSLPNSANGLLVELERRMNEYFDWVRDRTVLKQVEGGREYVEITTPHLDRHNDCIQFYVRRDDGAYLLTDDGSTIDDLEMSGCKLDSPKRQELLRLTLSGFGIDRKDNALVVRATPQTFARKKHDFIQAMLAVNDMFVMAEPIVARLFIEDVEAWLEENGVRSVPRVKFSGRTGYDHTFDFVIPGFRKAPERIVQAINHPSKNAAEAMVLKWIDTREARDPNSAAYALLNDQEQSVPTGVADALHNYDIHPVPWSERDRVIEELAA
jgi:hypothetical protein